VRHKGSLCIYYFAVAFLKVGNEGVDDSFENGALHF
jgi:hypothetical protein